MTVDDTSGEVQEYVAENRDLLSRMLTHGNAEAQGYALALLANGEDSDNLEQVQREFDKLRNDEE